MGQFAGSFLAPGAAGYVLVAAHFVDLSLKGFDLLHEFGADFKELLDPAGLFGLCDGKGCAAEFGEAFHSWSLLPQLCGP
jgi:hypothetical protein